MLSLLGPVGGAEARQLLASKASDPDPFVRVGLLRALRAQEPEFVAATATHLLRDPVRSVRIEAALTFVDYRDLLPLEDARAFAGAAEEYRQAMLEGAFMPDGAINLAGFESRLGNAADAAKRYEHAIRIGDGVAEVQYAYGLYKVRSGDAAGAMPHLRRATELGPDTPWFFYVYGVALNSTGESAEAIRVLRDARGRFPDDFDVAWALVTMLRDTGDRAETERLLTELQAQFPGNPQLAALAESLR